MQKEKAYFKLITDFELKEIIEKNKNLFQLKEVQSVSLPLIGTANCNK